MMVMLPMAEEKGRRAKDVWGNAMITADVIVIEH